MTVRDNTGSSQPMNQCVFCSEKLEKAAVDDKCYACSIIDLGFLNGGDYSHINEPMDDWLDK